MQDFRMYFELGCQHILDWQGYNHILFVTALCGIYTLHEWRRVLILVTAFTLGHSLTLALSVYNLVRMPSALIEFLIPVTIVATSFYNIIKKESSYSQFNAKYVLAALFGLIHGLGFSNYLKSLLGRSTNIVAELFAFNIGLELGQVLIVAVVLSLSYLVVRTLHAPSRDWTVFISSAIFGIAVVMSVERLTLFIHHT